MQIKLFTIPVTDNDSAIEELNKFLRGHKILEVNKELVKMKNGVYWCFAVTYIGNVIFHTRKEKVDYKNKLSSEVFEVFTVLRKIRKELADEDGVPAYAVFTDEELTGIAGMKELNTQELQKIRGIGIKKIEKYGSKLIDAFKKYQGNETSRKPD